MDFINELGELALVSRLRRLSERMMHDVAKVYKLYNIEFEARWFPIFYLLKSQSTPLSILDIAKALGITHPSVNQIAGDMLKKELLVASSDPSDKRKRFLELSEKGKELIPHLETIWNGIHESVKQLTKDVDLNILEYLAKIEKALDEKNIQVRYQEIEEQRQITLSKIEIVEYKPEFKEAFQDLNYEWIKKFFYIEESDIKILSNPEEHILKNGGFIFMAKLNTEILGTCALIKCENGIFELSKMAVKEGYQGEGIGKQLAYRAIETAIAQKATEIVLETNSKLKRAINLYLKMGFEMVTDYTPAKSEYQRADVKMRLKLNLSDPESTRITEANHSL